MKSLKRRLSQSFQRSRRSVAAESISELTEHLSMESNGYFSFLIKNVSELPHSQVVLDKSGWLKLVLFIL